MLLWRLVLLQEFSSLYTSLERLFSKGFIGKRLVRKHSMPRWLGIISDSQPKQISPQSRWASAHISNTRHAAFLPLLMFLLDFSPSSSLSLYLQGIAPLFLCPLFITQSSPLWVWFFYLEWLYLSIPSFFSLWQYHGRVASIQTELWMGKMCICVCEREHVMIVREYALKCLKML